MEAERLVTIAVVQEALNILRGAVMIVYPMGLPPHDPIRMEMENKEELEGTHVCRAVVFYCFIIGCVFYAIIALN